MYNYSLLLKISILLYSAYSSFSGSMIHAALLMTALLLITALSFLIPVIKDKKIKMILIGLSIINICMFYYMFPFLIFFLPILTIEFLSLINLNRLLTIFLVFTGLPLTVSYHYEPTFFLIAVFCAILYFTSQNEKAMQLLESQYEVMQLKNRELIQKIEYHKGLIDQLTYTAQLEERNRIAQELHDRVGHSISGSLMQLEAAKLLTITDPPKSTSILQGVIDTLRDGLDAIRITLRNLKPPAQQMGINRLKVLLDQFKEKHPIKISFSQEGDLSRISPIVWKIFIDNTQEALTNLSRHSKADQAYVSIYVMNKIIRFRIKDNGSCSCSFTKGLGLAGMEERLSHVNGSLIVDNSDGFSLTMLVPDGGNRNGN